MHFLAPSLLLGLLAAVVPFVIHRIGRRRARPFRFAAMELLLRAERQVSARRRLRELALLIVRTAVAAALPLLYARPYAEVRSDLPAVADRPQSAVIVLDDSASMRRAAGGVSGVSGATVFDQAKARARALVDSMSPESDLALVLASEGAPTPIADPSSDHPRFQAVLDGLGASARRGDVAGALARAAQILQGASRPEKRIYLVTDLQASGFPAEPAPLPAGIGVSVLEVGVHGSPPEPWENRAVLDVTAEPAPEAGAQGVAVVAEIANFSARPAAHVGVSLRLDGTDVARGFVDLPAGGRVKKRFLHAFSGGGAAHEAAVAIDGGGKDAFPLDDVRLGRVEVSRGLRVLVVDGDPRTVRNEDEVFFLEAALRAGGSRFRVEGALPDDLAGRHLDDYAAIFLANVARPSAEAAVALTRYVTDGGGLFVSVGERVDTEIWNQRMRALLPQPLGLRRTAAAKPGTVEGETVDTRPAERLGPIDRRHPLVAGLGSGEGLTSARFFQYMLLEPQPESGLRTVVLRYENGAPALIEAAVGRGRVLLLTTTVDREWTDLPIRPGFLPLVQEAARRLAGVPSGDAVSAVLVGATREIQAGPDDRRIEVSKPNGDVRALAPQAEPRPSGRADLRADLRGDLRADLRADPRAGLRADLRADFGRAGRVALFSETDQIGGYRVRAVRAGGAWVDRPDESFVVNLDGRESDPALLPPERRPDRQGASDAAASAPARRLEVGHLVGAALVVLLLIESLLTLRTRRNRAGAAAPAASQ